MFENIINIVKYIIIGINTKNVDPKQINFIFICLFLDRYIKYIIARAIPEYNHVHSTEMLKLKNIPDNNKYLILLFVVNIYIKSIDNVINKTKCESTVPILV